MNIQHVQHASRQDDWLTPIDILARARRVLGGIDLDPASSYQANKRVGAARYIDEAEDGLVSPWGLPGGSPASVWVNAPGGKVGNRSKTHLFWQRLMGECEMGNVDHAVFLFFSVEGLAVSQGRGTPAATEFPVCIPKKRIRFDHPTDASKQAPSHSNAIVYVPGTSDATPAFYREFSDLGDIVVPYREFVTGKGGAL